MTEARRLSFLPDFFEVEGQGALRLCLIRRARHATASTTGGPWRCCAAENQRQKCMNEQSQDAVRDSVVDARPGANLRSQTDACGNASLRNSLNVQG